MMDESMYESEGMDHNDTPKDESETPTALLPKSILGGKEFKAGEEVVLKIVKVYGDEVEVEYATGTEPKEKTTDQEIDELDKV